MASLRAFTMPKWGIEMTEGVVAEWIVEEGQSFSKDDLVALIETDKITNEVEIEHGGYFARLIAEPGETYPVGALLAVQVNEGESADPVEIDEFVKAFAQPTPTRTKAEAKSAAKKPTENNLKDLTVSEPNVKIDDDVAISPVAKSFAEKHGVDVSMITGSGRDGRIIFQDVSQAAKPEVNKEPGKPVDIDPIGNKFDHVYASPLAKRLAVQHNVDLESIEGSGPRGRICKSDVLAMLQDEVAENSHQSSDPSESFKTASSGAARIVKMSSMRKAIARSLTYSKSNIPHYYLRNKVILDAVIDMRESARLATGEAPSLNDYIVRACALALMRHPDVNIQVHGDEIHHFDTADIAVAVATSNGLLTPIIRNAETKSVTAISRDVKALAERARSGKLKLEEFQGGGFSISNLGMYGIDQFAAIINPPQGAILAVGAGLRQPIEVASGIGFATVAELSLSCDHRAIDGAVGAAFMKTLRQMIEEPSLLTA